MQETTKTTVFVGLAVLSLGAAYLFAPALPKQPDEFKAVGTPFYDKDFDALDAKALTVVTFNEATATSKEFSVEFKNGVWAITSHLNYPADGKDRLARTAASVVGIKRESFKTRDASDYADLGVIDPLEKDSSKLQGRGQRITLKDGDGQVLADYIIGKSVKDRPGYYYVRRADEKSVYIAKLNIDVSTKFSDWIESDLLKMQPDQLREIVVHKYSIDETRGRIVGEEISRLTRDKAADPWKLEGLDEKTEEVNADAMRTMVSALDDLKIIGVRKKPEGLSEDLRLDKGIKLDAPTVIDLQRHGFMFTKDGELKSNEGEVIASVDTGAVYVLRFGEIFSGSELETETGLGADAKPADEKAADQDAKDGKEDAKEKEKKGDRTDGRYLFITAHFDPKYLGPEPVKPEPPAAAPAQPKPADEDKPAAKPDADKTEADKPEAEKTEKKPAADDKAPAQDKDESQAGCGAQPAGDEPPADAKQPEPAKPAADKPAQADPAQAQYEAALKKYEADLEAYNKKVKAGEELVADLNRRFADWYYVISADSYSKLRLSRKELVKEKPAATPAADAKPESKEPGEKPAAKEGEPKEPGDKPAKTDDKSAAEKPDAAPPAGEKPADKPAADKPAEEKPDAEKSEKPAAEKSPEAPPAEKQPNE